MIPLPPDELDRLRAAFREDARETGPTDGCPSADDIWLAATGDASADATGQVVEHLATCGACGEAWRLARAFVAEGTTGAAQPVAGHPAAPTWTGRLVTLAAAAILVVAAGAAYQQGWFGGSEAPVFRSSNDPLAVENLLGDTPLPRAAAVLRWSPGPDGSRYSVTVTSEDLTPLASASALSETQFVVPADALTTVPSGDRIVWQVETITDDGRRALSRAFVTRIED